MDENCRNDTSLSRDRTEYWSAYSDLTDAWVWSVGRDVSVGTATIYRLDGPGIASHGGEIFCARPDWRWVPPFFQYNG